MSEPWFIVMMVVAIVAVSASVGYRYGVIAGYDKAERMLGEITEQQYKRIKERELK